MWDFRKWIFAGSIVGCLWLVAPDSYAQPRYGVQIGAYLYAGMEKLLPIAQQVAERYQCEVGIWNQGSWYKVIAGNFVHRRAAFRLLRQLRRDYAKAFVVVLPDSTDRVVRVLPDRTTIFEVSTTVPAPGEQAEVSPQAVPGKRHHRWKREKPRGLSRSVESRQQNPHHQRS